MSEDNLNYYNGLPALLEEDLSAFEYYNSLPLDLKRRLEHEDVNSFDDMLSFVEEWNADEEYPRGF